MHAVRSLQRRSLASVAGVRSATELRLPAAVRVVEVGPRDGLQNEPHFVPTAAKARFIGALRGAGLRHIEATSFVSPKWVPQMGDAADVMAALRAADGGDAGPPVDGTVYSVLTPNMKGLEAALAAGGVGEVAVFAAASESFARKNTNCSIDEVRSKQREVVRSSSHSGERVRPTE